MAAASSRSSGLTSSAPAALFSLEDVVEETRADPRLVADAVASIRATTARARVRISYFEAGHMMYIHQPSLVRMAKELRAFVTG